MYTKSLKRTVNSNFEFCFILGAKPSDTPSFYSFMNYADFGMGTWHPKTGMFDVVRIKLSQRTGSYFHTNSTLKNNC
jgi:phytoene desaturase